MFWLICKFHTPHTSLCLSNYTAFSLVNKVCIALCIDFVLSEYYHIVRQTSYVSRVIDSKAESKQTFVVFFLVFFFFGGGGGGGGGGGVYSIFNFELQSFTHIPLAKYRSI